MRLTIAAIIATTTLAGAASAGVADVNNIADVLHPIFTKM